MAINRSLFYKELSKKESNLKVQDLLKERINLQSKHFQPGNVIFSSYNAKDKTQTYDKTPLALILRRGQKYTLVLNFHWVPLKMRITLIKHIIALNKNNIKKNKLMEFNYAQIRPMLKTLGYAPCIRLYINGRMGKVGVVIPPERLIEIARLRAETFTNGQYSAKELYDKARKSRNKIRK